MKPITPLKKTKKTKLLVFHCCYLKLTEHQKMNIWQLTLIILFFCCFFLKSPLYPTVCSQCQPQCPTQTNSCFRFSILSETQRLAEFCTTVQTCSESCFLICRCLCLYQVNDEGYTPLMEAAREGHEEMVALLLAQGKKVVLIK